MPRFQIVSDFIPTGDQPTAIEQLIEGINRGDKFQTLLGATGTGKTFTIAHVVQETQRPALVLVHNKTLAAQLYAEFKELFPHNAVEYFVSYSDYYQPEAYVPRHDLYIEKAATYPEIIYTLGYRRLIDGWPRWRKSIRSDSRKRGFDFLTEWLPTHHPELLTDK